MPEKSGLLATVSGITIIRSQESTFTILCSHHQEMTEVTRSSPRLSLLVLFWLKEIILTPYLRESPRTPTGHLSGESVPGASWSSIYKLTRWYPSPIPQMLSATNWPVLTKEMLSPWTWQVLSSRGGEGAGKLLSECELRAPPLSEDPLPASLEPLHWSEVSGPNVLTES